MLFFHKTHNRIFSFLLTGLFLLSWVACSAHISLTPNNEHADALPNAHQSEDSHTEEAVNTCFDHTPTQVVNRDQNESHNIIALVSNPTANLIESIENRVMTSRIFSQEDDPFDTRYSFLIDGKLII